MSISDKTENSFQLYYVETSDCCRTTYWKLMKATLKLQCIQPHH